MRSEHRRPGDQRRSSGPNGSRALPRVIGKALVALWVVVGLGLLYALLHITRSVYTDWLWFDQLGYLGVFARMLATRVWVFFVGALVVGPFMGINLYLAYRYSEGPSRVTFSPESRFWVRRATIAGLLVMAVLITVIFGAIASSHWATIILFLNPISFGLTDPLYHVDVSFYVFTMPFLHLVQGWLLGATITALLATLLVYFVRFSLRGVGFPLSRPVRAHMAVLGGLVMLPIAWGHFLDTYEILLSPSGVVTGATYADIVARRPALLLLTAVAILAGVLMFGSAAMRDLQRGVRLAIAAFGLWGVCAVLVGLLYPAAIQRFVVDPNELEREGPYIERNIQWTRLGFGLDRVSDKPYPVREASPGALLDNPQTVNNFRLWDPRPLKDIYNQIQHLRLYYEFLDVDVDRYMVDGQYRQVLLGARELSPERLPPEAQRWSNRKLQFTHGYGVVMSPATGHTTEGNPTFVIKDVPPQGSIAVGQPQIYYGEGQRGFVIVGTRMTEFDHPSIDQGGNPVYASYEGTGGVPLSSTLRRLAYAWQSIDLNILISEQLTPESRIQYRRTVRERLSALAPFLRLDADPYIVVDEGELYWVQDAYTVTDRLPYSQRVDGTFNYVRNSVKAVVNAYNGTVQLYVAEPDDPLVRAYARAFPGLFLSLEEMPEGLRAHIRYPEDLFLWQARTYLQYHMTDPRVFFNKEDQWSIPTEAFFGATQPVEPYPVITKLPGEEKEEYVLLIPFTPAKKPNMVGWLAARNDTPFYGQLVALRFPADRQVDGPSQVEARIGTDPLISQQFTLWGQAGSTVLRGKLLVTPVGGTIVYAEPVYLQSAGLKWPQLKRVILATQDKVVRTASLQEGLSALVGQRAPPAASPGGAQPPAAEGLSTEELRRRVQALLEAMQSLQEDLANLQEALRSLEALTERSQP